MSGAEVATAVPGRHPGRRRVLYVASGNPVSPSSGLDIVVREHLSEIAADPSLLPVALCVATADRALVAPGEDDAFGDFTLFSADPAGSSTWSTRWRKLRHVMSGKLIMNFSLVSTAARRRVRAELARKPDVIIIDHVQTLANVSLWRLLMCRTRLIVITHDVTALWLRDQARLRRNRLARLLLAMEGVQARLVELVFFLRADCVVFLSDWDRDRYPWLSDRCAMSLCPTLGAIRVPARGADPAPSRNLETAEIVFIGSPGFSPNRFAIDWLVDEFAPHLLLIAPALTVTLVGRGTESIAARGGTNVRSRGFVPDAELSALLESCLCSVCPVVHGGGLKIKLLEAFSAGCPVFATEQALRGYGFMGLQPLLALDEPAEAAALMGRMASDDAFRATSRARIRSAWARHVADRRGALGTIIRGETRPARRADVVAPR